MIKVFMDIESNFWETFFRVASFFELPEPCNSSPYLEIKFIMYHQLHF